jgi:PqqD family protein of HPr-rel-A system
MDRIQKLAISPEGFIFDPTSGESYTVNKSGLLILRCLRENKTPEETAEELTKEFEDTPEEVEKDIADFLDTLRMYRLV